MDPDQTGPKKPKPYNNYLKYSSLGLQLLFGIGLSAWAGHALDDYLHLTFPAFLLSFVFLAFGGMMYQVYRSINQDQ
jgi:F0F1-type ATP synthase assembly protein I